MIQRLFDVSTVTPQAGRSYHASAARPWHPPPVSQWRLWGAAPVNPKTRL